MAVWVLTILYPAAFGVAYVLLTFTSLPTTLGDLVRPLAVVAIGTVLVTLVLATLLRSRYRGAIAASILVTAVSAPFLIASAVAAALVVILVQLVRRQWTLSAIRSAPAARLSRGVAVFASSYLIVAVALAIPAVAASLPDVERPAARTPDAEAPNIYLLLLDGYARGDTLASVFDHDNSAFEAGLEQLGFEVAPDSRSNYAHSWVTMTAMLNGAHIADIPGLLPPSSTESDQFRSLMVALNEGDMIRVLRDHGYRIGAIPPPFQSLGLSTADDFFNSGQMTDFEYSLLVHSQLGRAVVDFFPDFIVDQVRERFEAALHRLETAAGHESKESRFLLAHIFSPPHAPLVYGADGEELPLAECVPATCRLWEFPEDAWAGLSDQITYLNGRLLTTLEKVVTRDPTAVIVLSADHGARRSGDNLPEYFEIFFAARTPGDDVYPSDPDSVNVIRRLADSYLGTDLGDVPYEAWYSPTLIEPLDLRQFRP